VADGFTGNVVLKMYEGVSSTLLKKIKGVFMMRFTNKLAALVLKKDINALKKTIDYNEYGGAPMVGVTKPVFKAHGSSKAKTFYNALKLTYKYVEAKVTDQIAEAIAQSTAAETADEA
jgi:glycerol-3-phosphate acyltransferase PlsX